ncbi:MAG: anthranilate synthase component I [Candidatus Hydrogenedentes bacterium]|nr:anthranilate synthase component I [Candidatus Hydrogenedentota bacterium]
MIHPTREEFRRVATPRSLVPVHRDIVADLETPVSAYMKIATDHKFSFLLESVEKADTIGRYSFLSANPSIVFQSKGNQVTITRNGEPSTFESLDPLTELKTLMAQYRPVQIDRVPGFHGGAVGYMSYDQVRFFEKLPDENPDTLGLPDLYFMITDTILIFDHVNNLLKIVSNAHVEKNADGAYDAAVQKIDAISALLKRQLYVPTTTSAHADATTKSSFSNEGFCDAVRKAKEYISAGDIFQVVLSQRFERKVNASPINLYRALRCINPSPYMLLLQFPDMALVGSSPEVMTQVRNGRCMVRPIAGTRPRGATPEHDLALETELLADEKEIAEHVMLLDLGRNDVGRICKPGTVAPTKRMSIERYSHVMHIVSQVEGDMLDEADAYDALRATFPMGTVSGAPKIRAMQIIDELEPLRRGPYSGGAGYISFNGEMDTCIIIRTMILKDGVAYVQAGAGIVYDSVPEREFEETVNKAKALFRAVEFAEKGLEL